MKQKINVLIIAFLAVVILVMGFLLAINSKKESLNYFYDSGYIINNSYEEGTDNVNKVYFDDDAVYKKSGEDYTFTNTEGDKSVVTSESFVHYSDESIMALKKGVAIDLEKIDSKLLSYYNIFEGSVLTKTKDGYQINNLNESLIFQKMMFKLSSNKYLIAYSDIVICFSDDQTINMKDYVEIEYINENVIRIYNDEVNYQTIASDLYILINNIKIDLEYKTISKNGVQYLTMADMVINSNDNIEVLPSPEKIELPQETPNDNNDNNNNNTGNSGNTGDDANNEINSNVQDGLDNIINKLPSDDEQVDVEDEFIQPKFKVDSLEVTTLGFEKLQLSLEDESSVLYGNRTVEILENSTGKIVASFEEWEEGSQSYTINSFFSLKPNTEYTLNVVGKYKIENTIYDRTFISKIFKTLDIGLEIIEDYITDDSISYAVYKNTYSDVNGFTYVISDSNGKEIASDKVRFSDLNVVTITEEKKFKPNTKYTLTIKDIQYGNTVFSTVSYENLKLTHKTKTLKENPFKADEKSSVSLNSSVDEVKEKITFSIDGLNDKYGGIVDYTYNIYNAADDSGVPIFSITRNNDNDLVLTYSDLGFESNNMLDLYYNVKITFDDNEKTIIFTSENSNLINLSGVSYPKVVDFKQNDDSSFDTLSGTIILDNAESIMEYTSFEVVLKNGTNPYDNTKVVYSDNVKILTETDFKGIPFTASGLIPNTEYTLYVYFFKNTDDPNTVGIERTKVYVGYITTKTTEVEILYLTVDQDPEGIKYEENSIPVFDFSIQRSSTNNENNIKIANLKAIKFEMYECGKDETTFDNCNLLDSFKTTLPFSVNSTELNDLFENKTINLNSNNFKFYIEDYEYPKQYVVKVKGQANNYEIPIVLEMSTGTLFANNAFLLEFNSIPPVSKVNVKTLTKAECEERDDCKNELGNILENDKVYTNTIIAYNIEMSVSKNTRQEYINKIIYDIKDTNGDSVGIAGNTCSVKNENKLCVKFEEADSFTSNIIIPIDGDKIKRGSNYTFEYYGIYNSKNNDGVELAEENLTTQIPIDKHLFAYKQPAEISGYISSYDGNILKFYIEKNDIDGSIIDDLKLVDNNGNFCGIRSNNQNYYEFTGYGNCTSLIFEENLGSNNTLTEAEKNASKKDGVQKRKIYDISLDTILNINGITANVDATSPGKIKLVIPYDTTSLDEDVSGSSLNLDIKNNLNKIVGLRVGSKFVKLEDNGTELYAQINLSDIKNDIEYDIDYEISEGTTLKLTFEDVDLVYNNGKIIDINKDENITFVKSKNYKNYYNNETKNFDFYGSKLSIKNIISLGDLINDIKRSKYISLNEENSSIGYYLDNEKILKTWVEFNEVAFVSLNLHGKVVEATDVLTTSEIKTTYTSSGAIINFELGTEIDEGDIVIELYEDNNLVSDNSKLNVVLGENSKTVEITFKDLNVNNKYKYSIKYKKDGKEYLTYNSNSQDSNENIDISPLISLNVVEKSSKIKIEDSDYWHWNGDKIVFNKEIKNSFDVKHDYYLVPGEEIRYSIIAIGAEGNEKYLMENGTLTDLYDEKENINLENKISLYESKGEKKLDSGSYKIKVVSSLYKDSEKIRDLKEIVLNDSLIVSWEDPKFSVNSTGDPTFSITVNDKDGSLVPCTDKILEKYVDKKLILKQDTETKQNVYFELYSLGSDADGNKIYNFEGYFPISFDKRTKYEDITDFFTENNLTKSSYKVDLLYCTINGNNPKTVTTGDINIYPQTDINIKTITLPDSYVLMMDSADSNIITKINKIVYQYSINGVPQPEIILSNLDDDINTTNNIIFTTTQNSNGTINYFLGISTESRSTSSISSLIVQFFDENGNLIQTYDPS